ncbi:hypothetical protein TRVA0_002S00584 [Trichomonascus vanleenenianus]|uniref:F-box protein n=1 Tax=Trichomonascus vanleenenianus TaxID=2268995 RepID=UPI003ECA6155
MTSLPNEIWLIVLQYLREYDYDIDNQLWRVRLVCRTLSTLADSLIWRKVSLVCDAKYKAGAYMSYDFEFKSLLDVVKRADRSDEASNCHRYGSFGPFLDTIKGCAYKAQLEDRYSVIRHIEAAKKISWNRANNKIPGSKLLQALLVWRNDRTAGVKAITEALTSPFRGHAKPKYYSTEIHRYNIDGMLDMVTRCCPYIKHVNFIVGETTGCDKAIRHIAKIFKDTKLETVNATLKKTNSAERLETRKQQMRILLTIVRNSPQRLILNVEYGLTYDIVRLVLNELPSDRGGTQLIIQSRVACGPVEKLRANIVSVKVRGMVDITRMQQSLSLHKLLTHLDFDQSYIRRALVLPDSVIDCTIRGTVFRREVTISSSYVKSLRLCSMGFKPEVHLFPELEYLRLWEGGIKKDTNGQRPFPRLKRLECDILRPGNNLTALLEALRPSCSVTLPYDVPPLKRLPSSKRSIPMWSLLLSMYLPPVVALRLASTKLNPDDLYFLQRLVAQQPVSQVHTICRYSRYPVEPKVIPAKYRTLVSSTSSQDNGIHISDTYALSLDFAKARLKNVFPEKLERFLAGTSPEDQTDTFQPWPIAP